VDVLASGPVDATRQGRVPALEHRPAGAGQPALEIHRSPRRRRQAEAHARDGTVVVRVPAGMSAADEERVISKLVRRVTGVQRAAELGGDEALARRAAQLADRYLGGVRPTSVTWTGRMGRRWGSCTPSDGTIRVSRDVASMPAFVRDYVLLHELAHLRVEDHSPAFHALLASYSDRDRARGYLEGFAAGRLAAATPAVPPASWDEPPDEPPDEPAD
jgi:predicted metal-dependent hydrolase